ncbi:unnamed protein product [Prorocentrum cordatum]|uniref:Uncharacterized protein n=1 Tax=Prorocentrum cordatum TaxID=2364126 RepID=A0ABN9SP98_9DINO|nr:unnamed protein product [Polarella glacialis]
MQRSAQGGFNASQANLGRAGPCALPGARAAVVPRLRRGAPAVRRVRERVLPGRPRVAGRGGAVRPGGHPRLPRGQQGRRGGEQGGVLQRGAGAGRGPRRALPRGVGQDGGGRPAALPRRRGGAAGPGRAPAARAARAGPRVVALRRRLGFARPSRRPSRGSFSSWARGAEPRELEGGAFGWAPLRRQAAQRSGGPGELRRRVPARPGPCPPAAGRRCAPCAQRAAARRGQARTAPASSMLDEAVASSCEPGWAELELWSAAARVGSVDASRAGRRPSPGLIDAALAVASGRSGGQTRLCSRTSASSCR